MPRADGVFVPHHHCTVASGDCFVVGRCLGSCTARKKQDAAQKIADLERRLVDLEVIVYRMKAQMGKTE